MTATAAIMGPFPATDPLGITARWKDIFLDRPATASQSFFSFPF